MNRRPSTGPGRPQKKSPRPPSPPDPDPGGGGGVLAALQAQADKMLAAASYTTTGQAVSGGGAGAGQPSIEDLLCRLHAQESIRDTRSSHLNLATNLLQKLSTSPGIALARLVITLHPGDEGYSLALHNQHGGETELARYGYEDTEILECVDSQEIPVLVMDLITDTLDQETADLYHGNCVLCEVRDCRGRAPAVSGAGPRYKSHIVLLRPTTQSIICDSLSLARPCQTSQAKWSAEDRVNLESQLLLASGGPLCLDPSPVVSLIAGKVDHTRKQFSSLPLRRHAVKRYSQAGHNRKRKLESLAAPSELALHDFIRSKQNQATTQVVTEIFTLTTLTPRCPGWSHPGQAEAGCGGADPESPGGRAGNRQDRGADQLDPGLPQPRQPRHQARRARAGQTAADQSCVMCHVNHVSHPQVDVQKFVRPLQRKAETTDMSPQLDSEYILETAERGQARIYHTRLTILKRPANEEYIGELYVERDFREEDKKGSTCRSGYCHLLVSRLHAEVGYLQVRAWDPHQRHALHQPVHGDIHRGGEEERQNHSQSS